MDSNPIYKIVVIGDGAVGKTTYVKRMFTGEFEKKYVATLGVEVHPLKFNTNYGVVRFAVWDTAGVEKFGGLRDGYYIHADGALLMFSYADAESLQHVQKWDEQFQNIRPNAPTVLCGNKVDLNPSLRKVNPMQISYHRKHSERMVYYDVSARSNYNFEKPFLHLARKLTGHEDLVFIEKASIIPPEVQLDAASIALYERELADAKSTPFEESDDDMEM